MIAMHRLASSHLEFSSKPEEPLQDSSSAKKSLDLLQRILKTLKNSELSLEKMPSSCSLLRSSFLLVLTLIMLLDSRKISQDDNEVKYIFLWLYLLTFITEIKARGNLLTVPRELTPIVWYAFTLIFISAELFLGRVLTSL